MKEIKHYLEISVIEANNQYLIYYSLAEEKKTSRYASKNCRRKN